MTAKVLLLEKAMVPLTTSGILAANGQPKVVIKKVAKRSQHGEVQAEDKEKCVQSTRSHCPDHSY